MQKCNLQFLYLSRFHYSFNVFCTGSFILVHNELEQKLEPRVSIDIANLAGISSASEMQEIYVYFNRELSVQKKELI